MDFVLDCLPCMLRQVLEASKMATENTEIQHAIMQDAIALLSRYPAFRNAPEVARDMHRIVKAHTGTADPYYEIKQHDLQLALHLLPELQNLLAAKDNKLYWALKASATGNVLDSAISQGKPLQKLDTEYNKPFAICDISVLQERLQNAKSLLILGDNTGETVFDCLLLQQFPHLQRTYAVRNAPVINDATMEDALASGLGAYAEVISSGSEAPGTLLDTCSDAFLEIFHHADIVISKGQGNYETLSDCPRELFFLLKAKCPVLAARFAVAVGDYIFRYKPDGTVEC